MEQQMRRDTKASRPGMTRRGALSVLAWVWLVAFGTSAIGAESESAVKAAYIYNFLTLIKWPVVAHTSQTSPFKIGVVGRDAISTGIAKALEGQKAGSRSIVVGYLSADDTEALRSCHLVFLSSGENLAHVALALKGLPILLVGQSEDFARNGGTIGFVSKNNKIKLEISREAARQAHLVLPSDLLSISTVVR
jgi:YfiR/HmsC-like